MILASPTRSPRRTTARLPISFLAASLVLVGATVVGAGERALASPRVISVANATVGCAHVSGTAKFNPRLRTRGTVSGLETVHLDLALTGCSSPALPPPITITGQLKGALVANTGTSCSTSLGTSAYSSVGALGVRWKTHGATISPTSSFAPQRVRPSKVQRQAQTNQTVKVGGPGSPRPSVVGDFTGGNGGRSSSFRLSWKRSAATCSVGLSELPITAGTLTFS